MRKKFIVGNWKMHKTPREGRDFARALRGSLAKVKDGRVAGVAPTLLACEGVREELAGSGIIVGAQCGYWEASGAFTGQVSMTMLKAAGFDFCLIGHSEQRQFFGETDATVNKRAKAALAAGLLPLVCIGELLAEREAGKTEEVLARQIRSGLAGLDIATPEKLIIAYEPVWAIGTGKTATPEMAQDAHAFCRKELAGLFGKSFADGVVIQYGGSAKADNAASLLAKADIDGLLVGGASLDVASFTAIVNA